MESTQNKIYEIEEQELINQSIKAIDEDLAEDKAGGKIQSQRANFD
jgi:hypothetical protein